MAVKNFYPELPEIPYRKTSIKMEYVYDYLNSKEVTAIYNVEIRRMCYMIFANESSSGKNGVNGNYAGIQADSGRWSDLTGQIATCTVDDSAPGWSPRIFICFNEITGHKDTCDLLLRKISKRGIYAGADGVVTIYDVFRAYLDKWVSNKIHKITDAEVEYWKHIYLLSAKLIK